LQEEDTPQVKSVRLKSAAVKGGRPLLGKNGPETVLLVDNDPLILNFIEDEISFYGYKPILVSSGEETLKMADNEKIDLLLIDIMISGTNGIVLAKQFAVLLPGIKILFMSCYDWPSIAHHGIPESEYAFIQKPFATDALVQKMRYVLGVTDGLMPLASQG
jgi:DNA-binding NtrC family response regulator